MTFGAGHFYVSQSDKGGLVFGGDLDGYNSYAQRGNLPIVEDIMECGMAVWPGIGRLRVLRHWGGIMDMTMDGSPIIDRTPVDGLYLNGGWCYGGFKATPASGWCFAHLIATRRAASRRHRLPARPLRHRPHDRRKGRKARSQPPLSDAHRIPAPIAVSGTPRNSRISATPTKRRPDGLDASAEALVDYAYLRDNPAGPHRELWYHGAGCHAWLVVTRNTLDHAIEAVEVAREVFRQCRGESAVSSAQAGSGQPFRTARGGVIDRSRRLRFSFDGKAYDGFAGDTLASALLANGVRLVGRSFKYHRPRGILSAGPEEPNALVELRTGARREPNIAATTVELHDGLEAASQNRWLSLRFDPLALVGPFASFMTAGFYYKTFMWPRSFWEKLYEPLIRRAAGLGRAAGEADPDHYEKAIAFCDVLVIGGGPAGLAAALAAGRSGARVILCDERFRARRTAACRARRDRRAPCRRLARGCRGRAAKPARGPRHARGRQCSASTITAPMARSNG